MCLWKLPRVIEQRKSSPQFVELPWTLPWATANAWICATTRIYICAPATNKWCQHCQEDATYSPRGGSVGCQCLPLVFETDITSQFIDNAISGFQREHRSLLACQAFVKWVLFKLLEWQLWRHCSTTIAYWTFVQYSVAEPLDNEPFPAQARGSGQVNAVARYPCPIEATSGVTAATWMNMNKHSSFDRSVWILQNYTWVWPNC